MLRDSPPGIGDGREPSTSGLGHLRHVDQLRKKGVVDGPALQPSRLTDPATLRSPDVKWLSYRWAPSSIHGWGVFARVRIGKGALIGEYKGPETEENGTYVLWVEDGDELCARDGENGLRFLNHSREPNAEFDGFELYALRDIEVDEEITFDYGDESLDFF